MVINKDQCLVPGYDKDNKPCMYDIYTSQIIPLMNETEPLLEKVGRECPDCNGSGEYTGATTTEDCQTCKGIGKV
jgi:hypothetical protein